MMQLDLFEEGAIRPQTDDTRKCTKCGVEKDMVDFHVPYYKKDNVAGRSYSCKACVGHQRRVLVKLKDLHSKPEDMRCDCCKEIKEVLHLDHNHTTDNFRGYLCINCNHGLGKFNDSITKLKSAMEYLSERP